MSANEHTSQTLGNAAQLGTGRCGPRPKTKRLSCRKARSQPTLAIWCHDDSLTVSQLANGIWSNYRPGAEGLGGLGGLGLWLHRVGAVDLEFQDLGLQKNAPLCEFSSYRMPRSYKR